MVIYLKLVEIIIIIAAISFVVIVFTKAFIDHLHGKCNCDECDGNCSSNCSGNCHKYTKDELKDHLKKSYLK